MHTTTLRNVGGSIMMVLPQSLLDRLNLNAGGTVGLTVEDGRLIVAPRSMPGHTLEGLLAEHMSLDPRSAEDRAWLDTGPTGREFL